MTHILLVDDEPLVLVGIQSMLRWEDYDAEVVGTARNGLQALELIEKLRPELVITGIKMPSMNGLQLMEAAQKRYGTQPAFIILTSYEEYAFVKEAIFDQELEGYRCIYRQRGIPEIVSWMCTLRDGLLKALHEQRRWYKNQIIVQIKAYIQANLNQRLNLQNVAAVFGFSPNYLSTLFAKQAECPFVEYVTREKIRAAKEMMREENVKLYEIAERLGFDNAFYFSKVFKKVEGCSPREYVQRRSQGRED